MLRSPLCIRRLGPLPSAIFPSSGSVARLWFFMGGPLVVRPLEAPVRSSPAFADRGRTEPIQG